MADGKIVIDSKLDPSGAEAGLSELQGRLESAGGKFKNTGKNLSKFVTAPVVGLGALAIKTGMDFEAGMSKVQAMTGATAGEMETLASQARQLGADTRFSATEAADAMSFLGMAGLSVNEITEAMPGLLDLAAAGQLELGRSADIATNVLSGFGMEAKDLGTVSDVLALAASSANTSVEQMGDAMSFVAPVAAGAGISMEETAAAIGMLSDAGIQGGRAGTTLRGVFSRLQNPVGEAKKVLEELGLSMEDINPATNSLAEIMETLEGTGMDSAQAIKLFGQEAGPGMIAMLSQGSEKLSSFTGELEGSEGAAADMAATMGDNAKGGFVELQSAIEELSLMFSDILLPIFTEIIDAVTDVVRKFQEMSPETQKTILIIAGIAAAVGPLLVLFGILISSVGAIIGALAGISPVGWIVIGVITAIIAIGMSLREHWDTIKEKAKEVFSYFAPLLETVKQSFQNLLDSLAPIMEALKGLWESLIPLLQTVGTIVGAGLAVAFGLVIGVINGIINAIGPLIEAFINFIDFAVNMVNAIVALFTGDFAGAWQYLKDAGQSTIDLFINLFNGLIEFVKGFVDGIVGFFEGLYNILVGNSIIPDLVNAIVDWFKNLFKWSIDLVKSIVNGIINWFTSLFNGAVNIFNRLRSSASSIWNSIRSVISSVVNAIRSVVSSVFNSVMSIASSIWNGIKNAISNAVNTARSIVTNVFNAMRNAVRRTMDRVLSTVKNIWDRVTSFLGGINLFNIGKDIIQGLINGVKEMASKVVDSVKGVIDGAISGAKRLLGISSPSKLFFSFGKWTDEGFIDGINSLVGKVKDTGKKMVESIIPSNSKKLAIAGELQETLDIQELPNFDVNRNFNEARNMPQTNSGKVVVVDNNNTNDKNSDVQIVSGDVHIDGNKAGKVLWKPVKDNINRDDETRNKFRR